MVEPVGGVCVCVFRLLFGENAERHRHNQTRKHARKTTHAEKREEQPAPQHTNEHTYICVCCGETRGYRERERTTFIPNTFPFKFVTMVRNDLVVCDGEPDSVVALKQL